MASPRWWHRLFLTSISPTRTTTNIYSRTKHYWEDPRTWGWTWSTHHLRDQEKNCIQRLRGAATHWSQCLSSRIVCLHRESFLQWEKRAQGGQLVSLSTGGREGHSVGVPSLNLLIGIVGESPGLNHWESDYEGEKGRGLQQPVHRSWQTKFIPTPPK